MKEHKARLKIRSGLTAKKAVPQDLRARLIKAAAAILSDEGYEKLSMRHVAERAKCSQMAMYRHFANKEALTQYLCVSLYTRFTEEINQKLAGMTDARKMLRGFVEGLIHFAHEYPDHYSLLFLVRHAEPDAFELREELGRQFLVGIQNIVRLSMPANTARRSAERCLRQILFCLHGGAALLIAHPKAYGLTRSRVVEDTTLAIEALLNTDVRSHGGNA